LKDILEKPSLDKDFNFFMKIIKPFVLGHQAFENEHLINGSDQMWKQIDGFFN
jgi:hypothetical protein